MRRWMAALALGALLLAGRCSSAAPMGRPYEPVAVSHWAYGSVRQLEARGYFTGVPEGSFSGSRRVTRYAFAAAVERMYQALQPRVLAASEPGSLRQEVASFRRLLEEFGSEIGWGPDVNEMTRQLETMEQRVARLEKESAATLRPSRESGGLGSDLFRPRPLGLRSALARSVPSGISPRSRTSGVGALGLGPANLQPGLSAGAGPIRASLDVERPDSLNSFDDLPLEDPSDGLSYQGELRYLLDRYAFRAFYGKHSDLWDKFGLGNPYYQLGANRAMGGGVEGALTERLAFELEAATLRPQDADALSRMLYIKGGVNYNLGKGYSLGLGYERARLGLSGVALDFSVYTMGFGRSFGPNTRLDFYYRLYNAARGASETGTADGGSRSAITQLSVRF